MCLKFCTIHDMETDEDGICACCVADAEYHENCRWEDNGGAIDDDL